jgi:hypothetical protein
MVPYLFQPAYTLIDKYKEGGTGTRLAGDKLYPTKEEADNAAKEFLQKQVSP